MRESLSAVSPKNPRDALPERSPRERDSRLDSLWLGAKRGLHATAVMTAFRAPISKSPPPPSSLLATVFGGDPREYPLSGLMLHGLYGASAGAAFGTLFGRNEGGPDDERERAGVLLGVLYGLALSAFGNRILLDRLLDVDLADDERFVFHVSHVIYGLTLGTALGSDVADEA